jgi:hypothetical protein
MSLKIKTIKHNEAMDGTVVTSQLYACFIIQRTYVQMLPQRSHRPIEFGRSLPFKHAIK